MGKITIKDIAEKAGVSPTAVSFAFNYPERLPEDTVERILFIAKEMRYIPNPVARSMISGHVGTLGVILPMPLHEIMLSPFLSEFLLGVSEVCDAEGLAIMIIPPSRKNFQEAINKAMVDGFISLGVDTNSPEMEIIEQRGIPFLTVDSEPIEGYPAINVDDEGGAYTGAKYILECGHRNITIVSMESETPMQYWKYPGVLKSRINGYLRALGEFSLGIDGQFITLIESQNSMEGGQKAFDRIWNSTNHPTAVITMSDLIAFGIISAAHKMNVMIPNELSILGFDDLQFSSMITPPLTTIHQPIYEKGKLAAEMLVNKINGIELQHIVLQTNLIIRESVSSV